MANTDLAWKQRGYPVQRIERETDLTDAAVELTDAVHVQIVGPILYCLVQIHANGRYLFHPSVTGFPALCKLIDEKVQLRVVHEHKPTLRSPICDV